jgi:hypothetical protein
MAKKGTFVPNYQGLKIKNRSYFIIKRGEKKIDQKFW